jgi:hypothetical protein
MEQSSMKRLCSLSLAGLDSLERRLEEKYDVTPIEKIALRWTFHQMIEKVWFEKIRRKTGL